MVCTDVDGHTVEGQTHACYSTYIHPHSEYCVQVRSPHLKKEIDILERIQRRAMKLVKGLKWKSCEERLKIFGLH